MAAGRDVPRLAWHNNRFGHGKSNKLVGLFHNLRLLKRMLRKLLYNEQCVGWNDEDDKTGVLACALSFLCAACLPLLALLCIC